jgi:hypothetical protein
MVVEHVLLSFRGGVVPWQQAMSVLDTYTESHNPPLADHPAPPTRCELLYDLHTNTELPFKRAQGLQLVVAHLLAMGKI